MPRPCSGDPFAAVRDSRRSIRSASLSEAHACNAILCDQRIWVSLSDDGQRFPLKAQLHSQDSMHPGWEEFPNSQIRQVSVE